MDYRKFSSRDINVILIGRLVGASAEAKKVYSPIVIPSQIE